MNAVTLLRNRLGAVNADLHDLVAKVDGVDLVEPVVPDTSPLGLTLWHIPRTQDWLVHTTIRAVPEVADSFPPKGLPDPNEYGFGTGLSPERARAAAGEVRPRRFSPTPTRSRARSTAGWRLSTSRTSTTSPT